MDTGRQVTGAALGLRAGQMDVGRGTTGLTLGWRSRQAGRGIIGVAPRYGVGQTNVAGWRHNWVHPGMKEQRGGCGHP